MVSQVDTACNQPGDALSKVAARLKSPIFLSQRSVRNEQAVIDAIEQWLAIPSLTGRTETELAANAGEDGMCTDPEFPPNASSLYIDPEHPAATASPVSTWKRIHGELYVPGKSVSILPGALRDRWLLGAIACVASRQDLILDLILSDDSSDKGLYTFQFYKHGCWHPVVVDDHLPCSGDEILFACSGTSGELWISLMEKAYAKLHGNYSALDGGSVGDALVDLTGGVLSKVKLDTEEGESIIESGALWSRLTLYCGWGYVIAAMFKVKPAADNATGPGGILLNHTYNIVDCHQLSDGARLLCVHNPWPVGQWHGAWADKSRECQNENIREELERLRSSCGGKGTFWMSYEDFTQAFNRLYVTQLFPPSWHQLTVHSGWHGRTAGGPMLVDERPNSTWCCNPQFKIATRQSGEVLLCVSQQDPLIRNGRHIPKKQRDMAIGFLVMEKPTNYYGRVWTPAGEHVLHDTGLQAVRELSVTITMRPEQCVLVVPYCSRPGQEGPFIIRTFSSAAIELTQVPSPLALVIGGAWSGHLAGGGLQCATWPSNPQFLMSTQQKSFIMLSLMRTAGADDNLPEYDQSNAIGMAVVEPEMGESGWTGRTVTVSDEHILVKSDHDRHDEATILLELLPDKPCLIVPSTTSSGLEGGFELRILSATAVEVVPMPERKCVAFNGSWESDSGGCDLNPYWFKRNPKYVIVPHKTIPLTISLSRLPAEWKVGTSLENMIGFYVCTANDVSGSVPQPARSKCAESPFLPLVSSTITYELKPSQSSPAFVIIPCTYGPGCMGSYQLSVSSSVPTFDIHEL